MIRFFRYGLALIAFGLASISCTAIEPADISRPVGPINTVESAIANYPACISAAPFYYEIGNATEILLSGTVEVKDAGRSASRPVELANHTRDAIMPIASASKWLFGAYVAEVTSDIEAALPYLRMQSGYIFTKFRPCNRANTVQDCYDNSKFGVYLPDEVGQFYYGSGHYQYWAVTNDLGSLTTEQIGAEFTRVLGIDVGFNPPHLAGGARMSTDQYVAFLRSILADELVIHDWLGEEAVCTLPTECATASYSPSPYPWEYSLGHWVEEREESGAVLSSPGAYGYYPWIDTRDNTYGVVARSVLQIQAYRLSADCGRVIRNAFRLQQSEEMN